MKARRDLIERQMCGIALVNPEGACAALAQSAALMRDPVALIVAREASAGPSAFRDRCAASAGVSRITGAVDQLQSMIDAAPSSSEFELYALAGRLRDVDMAERLGAALRRATEALERGESATNALMLIRRDADEMDATRCPSEIDLSRDADPLCDLVSGVCGRDDATLAGERVALVGPPKTNKSWFVAGLACACANGIPFCGFETRKSHVRVYDMEIMQGPLNRRYRHVLRGLGLQSFSGLHVISLRGAADARERIMVDVRKHRPDLIIIDPAYKIMRGDENDQRDIREAVEWMAAINSLAATIIVHHSAKGDIAKRGITDRISGSGILSRDADTILSLSLHALEGHLVLSGVARHHKSEGITRTLRLDSGVFSHEPEIEPVEAQQEQAQKSKQKTQADDLESQARPHCDGLLRELVRRGSMSKRDAENYVCMLALCAPRIARATVGLLVRDGEAELISGKLYAQKK